MDLDLIERARGGDPASLTALQAIWGPRAIAVATAAGADDAGAREAATEALRRAWQQLPAQHSRTAFRPWFLGLVVGLVLDGAQPGDADVAALASGGRGADQAARRILARAPGWLPSWPETGQPPEVEPVHVVRASLPATAHVVFATLRDPARVPVWLPGARVRGRRRLEAGMRLPARFGSAKARAMIVALSADRRIAFTLAVRPRRATGPFELRFALELSAAGSATDVAYALRGIAAPPHGVRAGVRAAAAAIARWAPAEMELGLGRLDAVLRRDLQGEPPQAPGSIAAR